MITSLGSDGAPILRGIEEDIRCFSGATSVRVVEGGGSIVEEHCHDWPILSLYVMGDVLKVQDGGSILVNRPTVILHGAREPHANLVGSSGLEQIDIQFDPAWIKRSVADCRFRSISFWRGGSVMAGANRLRLKWLDPRVCEAEMASATAAFLDLAFGMGEQREPEWLPAALRRIEKREVQSTKQLARELGMHPGWLAQAYRDALGEGLHQTLQRHRIEHATALLRTTNLEAADVAAAAGFCDQSHMIRSFKRLLGRTPSRVRAERERLSYRRTFAC